MEYEKTRFDRNKITFALIISDIDDFKQFNDQYGHDCGDYILVSAAEVIRSRVRKQDTTARWGGEEFLVLLPETDSEGGRILAESIHRKLSTHQFHYKEKTLSISMTFGVSVHSSGETIDDTIKKADQALYRGKRNGKNCIVVF
jgi:diguanylate cyclase (GGDEF)-like protein